MTKKVIAVKKGELIKTVFHLMDKHNIQGIPVIDDKKHIKGIVTETDLIAHFTTLDTPKSINLLGGIVYLDNTEEYNKHLKEHCAETVDELMTSPILTISETATLQEAIDIMSKKGKIRLPVVNAKKEMSGIITRSDIIHQLAKI